MGGEREVLLFPSLAGLLVLSADSPGEVGKRKVFHKGKLRVFLSLPLLCRKKRKTRRRRKKKIKIPRKKIRTRRQSMDTSSAPSLLWGPSIVTTV